VAEDQAGRLLAEIATRAAELRRVALEEEDHGLAVTARTIGDHAAAGAWGIGAVMGDDGFVAGDTA
jgi:hypothetical protein